MFDKFFDEFFRDPADEKEYEDMARGLNWAGGLAVAVLVIGLAVPYLL